MKTVYQNIRNAIRPVSFYIPFTFYFLLFSIAGALAYYWLHGRQVIPDTSFADIFKLLLQVLFWFGFAVITFALLTVSVAYIYFIWAKRKNKLQFAISTITDTNENNTQPKIHIDISPLLKPLLGFVKLRLQYDNKMYSDKLLAADISQKKFFTKDYKGDFTWHLPEIKEYQLKKVVVYFEDLFQFFSLIADIPVQSNFFRQPLIEKVKDFTISPMKTEETETRIEELKKVEGEYLSYKNFEDNDDVRRIVWKIYAKNKELVVRIPEILDPYASHACLYTSFYNSFDIAGNSTAEIFFLNYYKSVVWSIYKK
ncbi:MAG TPA: DUF58 domain-containing protein, partial [Chitinophagaceae bacterium]|nr:DUF58 domain-containing protein [Chitinophagaceae bacterium]